MVSDIKVIQVTQISHWTTVKSGYDNVNLLEVFRGLTCIITHGIISPPVELSVSVDPSKPNPKVYA